MHKVMPWTCNISILLRLTKLYSINYNQCFYAVIYLSTVKSSAIANHIEQQVFNELMA